jgi:hypothetical protein
MHSHTLDDWKHDHVLLGGAHERNERRTWLADLHGLSHVTVEVLRCNDPH